MTLSPVLTGLALSALIAGLAKYRRSLTLSGALAALGVGTAIYAGGGPLLYGPLLFFFFSSSALGKVAANRKTQLKLHYEKGDERDAWQVLANGGVAAACALAAVLCESQSTWHLAGLGALATATADTWATELGPLSRSQPISLRSGRRVAAGQSGAVSALGLLSTAAAGVMIGLVALLASPAPLAPPKLLLATLTAGVAGSLVDSLLGASLQAQYHCADCEATCEGRQHHCGATATRTSGVQGINNDVVNLMATMSGACIIQLWSA